MAKLFIGADPGMEGAWAAIDENSNIISYMANPRIGKTGPSDLQKICDWLNGLYFGTYEKVVMTVEDVHALYQVSVKTTSTLMESKGNIYGIMNAFAYFTPDLVTVQQITPKEWQKRVWMFHDKVMTASKVDTKKTSLACAKRLWPSEKFLASERCKTPHDGIVDALLIAEAARRSFNVI